MVAVCDVSDLVPVVVDLVESSFLLDYLSSVLVRAVDLPNRVGLFEAFLGAVDLEVVVDWLKLVPIPIRWVSALSKN